MTVRLQAPLPAPQTTTLLPNPQAADVDSPRHSMDMFRATDGTLRTSIKTNNRRLLTYEFVMDRLKAAELQAFVESYIGSKIRMRNHKDEVWEGHIANNPLDITEAGRNRVTVQLQFEGEKVS